MKGLEAFGREDEACAHAWEKKRCGNEKKKELEKSWKQQ